MSSKKVGLFPFLRRKREQRVGLLLLELPLGGRLAPTSGGCLPLLWPGLTGHLLESFRNNVVGHILQMNLKRETWLV